MAYDAAEYQPVEINGIWHEPITQPGTRKEFAADIYRMTTYGSMCVLHECEGGLVQIAIPVEEFNKINAKKKIKGTYERTWKKRRPKVFDESMMGVSRGGRKKRYSGSGV